MKFDVILTNPPFQDSVNRNKTPHKLWIDFTLAVFDRLLIGGGSLVQVSPASFSSPSNIVLDLMAQNQTMVLRLGTEHHFPTIGSSFSDYWIIKKENDPRPTRVIVEGAQFDIELDNRIAYLPNDLCKQSMSVHSKVMFADRPRLDVRWDYVTAHNIRRRGENPTLVEERTDQHPYPVFHTNRQTWWSSIRQPWADEMKVMWTRSGYARPFFDAGTLGGTDMVYYVPVVTEAEGRVLEAYLNSTLIQYVLKTAKWSGFGNERVFSMLPAFPAGSQLAEDDLFNIFGLNEGEVEYVRRSMEPRRRPPRDA